MTINVDTEIVASRYDAAKRMNHYTIERDGHRWTVDVPDDHLDKHGRGPGSLVRRRNHVASVLVLAMRGKPDGRK